MSDRFTLLGVGALVVAVSTAACSNSCSNSSSSSSSNNRQLAPPGTITKLEIEINGGFGFIPSPNDKTLNIAYLNSVRVEEGGQVVCNVPQVGTELWVERGVVDDYEGTEPLPGNRLFDLDGAQLKFPKLESADIPLKTPRKTWKPNPLRPANHADPAWGDLQYVPRIADHVGLTDRTIKPNWRSDRNVNGFMALKGGTLEGLTPSNPIAELAQFEFKVAGVSQGLVSGTDRAIYRVDVPDDRVEIIFTGAKKGWKRLVLKPNSANEAVRLRLSGLHAMNTPPKDGDELTDFCAFHSLLEPPVESSKYVRIYYKAPPRPSNGVALPSPGFFCDPTMF
jgi:hypothetical protein